MQRRSNDEAVEIGSEVRSEIHVISSDDKTDAVIRPGARAAFLRESTSELRARVLREDDMRRRREQAELQQGDTKQEKKSEPDVGADERDKSGAGQPGEASHALPDESASHPPAPATSRLIGLLLHHIHQTRKQTHGGGVAPAPPVQGCVHTTVGPALRPTQQSMPHVSSSNWMQPSQPRIQHDQQHSHATTPAPPPGSIDQTIIDAIWGMRATIDWIIHFHQLHSANARGALADVMRTRSAASYPTHHCFPSAPSGWYRCIRYLAI